VTSRVQTPGKNQSSLTLLIVATLFIYNGPTLFNGAGGENPFGHSGIAVTGSGLYSFGNSTALQSSVTGYLEQQAQIRSTTLVILPTSSSEEQKILTYFQKFPQNFLDPNAGITNTNTCATLTGNALLSAGLLTQQLGGTPGALIFPYSQLQFVRQIPGAILLTILRNGQVPAIVNQFNPLPMP
jgi:hypothetical protein